MVLTPRGERAKIAHEPSSSALDGRTNHALGVQVDLDRHWTIDG
jgi:hypothetical protein